MATNRELQMLTSRMDRMETNLGAKIDTLSEKFDRHIADDARNFGDLKTEVQSIVVARDTEKEINTDGRALKLAWAAIGIALLGDLVIAAVDWFHHA